ncbi:hypothetical protein [Phormidium sp. CCY1219]|nr:hypothetical protein [Phormidium sp. CCY1219]
MPQFNREGGGGVGGVGKTRREKRGDRGDRLRAGFYQKKDDMQAGF